MLLCLLQSVQVDGGKGESKFAENFVGKALIDFETVRPKKGKILGIKCGVIYFMIRTNLVDKRGGCTYFGCILIKLFAKAFVQ